MNELKEGEDFYYNASGYMVFTAKHHLQRGHCCGNGCLHCPYGATDTTAPIAEDPLADA